MALNVLAFNQAHATTIYNPDALEWGPGQDNIFNVGSDDQYLRVGLTSTIADSLGIDFYPIGLTPTATAVIDFGSILFPLGTEINNAILSVKYAGGFGIQPDVFVEGVNRVDNPSDYLYFPTAPDIGGPFGSQNIVLDVTDFLNSITELDLGTWHSTPLFILGTYSTDPGFRNYASASLSLDISGSSSVPEPATILLLGAGLLSFGILRRKIFQ